jgi:fatty acid desaturase
MTDPINAPPTPRPDDNRSSMRYELARRRVQAMTGFYVHLAVFAAVMLLLLAINAATGPAWWVQWPALGWGIGLAAHGLAVFGRAPAAIKSWQERKIDEIAQRRGD